jgi:hypothetical protein
MNKTLTTLGVGIWGVIIFLNFILKASLQSLGLSSEQISSTLIPLSIIEIVAFIITVIGLFKNN